MVHKLTDGGAERVAALWVKGFLDRGNSVGLVLNCKKHTPQTYSVPECVKQYNIYHWLKSKLPNKIGVDCFQVFKIRKIINDFQPDLIIGVMQPWAEWARKALNKDNICIINTEHSTFDLPENAPKAKKKRLQFRIKHDVNYPITVLTEADKKYLKGNLNNVWVLPNPLAFEPAKTIPAKNKVILAAGRLDEWYQKGFDILIKAWGKVAKDFPEWKLEIAGQGKDSSKQVIQTLVNELQLNDQFKFLGYQSFMQPVYKHSSIFVLASRYEGFGLVLVEAMSQGCAPIACDYKGRQSEIITSDKEGIICQVNNVDEVSNALRKLIENEEYRFIIQKNAIERSKYYSLDHIMDVWDAIINKV